MVISFFIQSNLTGETYAKDKIFVDFIITPCLSFSQDHNADPESAKIFFQQYTQWLDKHNPSIVELYSDSAEVSVARRYPEKLDKAVTIKGSQWKSIFSRSMAKGDQSPDQYTYSNIEISTNNTKAKITANRYVILSCYTDPEYYMVINKESDGSYKIIEEYFEVQPMSFCSK